MSRNGVCPRCGGTGTIWTGAERIRCPNPKCDDGRIRPR
jgi:hypothetical protein